MGAREGPKRPVPLSKGLELLFANRPQANGEAENESATAAHSPHFGAYHAQSGQGGVVPTGIPHLDEVLAGGLDLGLTTVAGAAGTGKTLVLEETARSALLQNRTVVYAALRDGSLGAWQRLMARYSQDVAGLPLSLSELRARSLDETASARLEQLDTRFAQEVLPRLVLLDRLPPGDDGLQGLLDNLWWRLREAMEQERPSPLLLLDGLEAVGHQTQRLHAGLQKLGVPGMATSGPLGAETRVADGGLLLLRQSGDEVMGYESQLLLTVARNPRTGWQGRIQLRLDRALGRVESLGPDSEAPGQGS